MLILAPMQGLTELMFRKAYWHCFPGALDLSVSPFLSLTHGNLADAWKKIDDVIPSNNADSIPVIPQILGKEQVEFIDLANRLFDVGYTEVNWNIGCPMRRVTAKHRGSGILPYPDEVHTLLDRVIPNLKPRLSVKMRLGLNVKEEIFALVPILNDYPLASVTVHPRTGRQQYSGQVDLDTFELVYKQFNTRVIYNGDICSTVFFRQLRQRFPQIEDFMIGRGILYDPTLPLKIKGIIPEDDKEKTLTAARLFTETLLDAILARPISDESKMHKIKEYWCLLFRSLAIPECKSRTLLHSDTLSTTIQTLHSLLRFSQTEGTKV